MLFHLSRPPTSCAVGDIFGRLDRGRCAGLGGEVPARGQVPMHQPHPEQPPPAPKHTTSPRHRRLATGVASGTSIHAVTEEVITLIHGYHVVRGVWCVGAAGGRVAGEPEGPRLRGQARRAHRPRPQVPYCPLLFPCPPRLGRICFLFLFNPLLPILWSVCSCITCRSWSHPCSAPTASTRHARPHGPHLGPYLGPDLGPYLISTYTSWPHRHVPTAPPPHLSMDALIHVHVLYPFLDDAGHREPQRGVVAALQSAPRGTTSHPDRGPCRCSY
jgi:hypothetical protein